MQNNFNISIFTSETANFMKKYFLYLMPIFILFFVSNLVSGEKPYKVTKQNETGIFVLVIDPGHGGKDPGAVLGKAREKDIVLDIALKLGNYIKTNFPETKVIYTRKKDVFIPLNQRAIIANKNKADLFISIHANSVDRKSVQGAETFVLGQHRSKDNLEVAKTENSVILLEDDYSTTYEGFDPKSPESYIMFELVQDEYLEQSVMFASAIQDQFRERAKRIDRSVKQAGFLVLRQTTMPSVLVEAGFLSHTSERNYLLSETGKSNIASAIFRAFRDYKKKIEVKSSFNLITENQHTPEAVAEIKPTGKIKAKKNKTINSTNISFSVQIAASQNSIETSASNFNGEKNIFKIKSGKINRYFSGKFQTHENALKEKSRLQNKFSDAFVVAFEDDKLISVKKALGKM
jgi:N-acetylmuramoyl-L-alanine amidase